MFVPAFSQANNSVITNMKNRQDKKIGPVITTGPWREKICYQSIGTLLKALSAFLGEDHLLPDKSIKKQAVEF